MNVHCSSPEGIFVSTDPRADRWKEYHSTAFTLVFMARPRSASGFVRSETELTIPFGTGY